MIDAVIFDVDGTLVDSVDYHAEAWTRAFAQHGKPFPFEALRSQIGKGGDQLLPEFLDDTEIGTVGKAIEATRQRIFKDEYLDRVKGFPGAAALLAEIRRRGKRIALASSAKGDELKIYKAAAGIDGLTDVETCSDDAERSKPHPDIFKAALKRLELDPKQVLVIGDTPYDADAATRAGIASIGVLCGGFKDQDIRKGGATAIFRDPQDLLARMDMWLA